MEKNAKKEAIVLLIKSWGNREIIESWNNRCEHANYPDDRVYCNDERFFEENYYGGREIMNIVRDVTSGYYKAQDDYVYYNGYGKLVTFSYWEEENSPIDIEEIAEWLMRDGDEGNTAKVNIDEMIEAFIVAMYEDKDTERSIVNNKEPHEIYDLINEYLSENADIDLLTSDWEEVADEIEEYYKSQE